MHFKGVGYGLTKTPCFPTSGFVQNHLSQPGCCRRYRRGLGETLDSDLRDLWRVWQPCHGPPPTSRRRRQSTCMMGIYSTGSRLVQGQFRTPSSIPPPSKSSILPCTTRSTQETRKPSPAPGRWVSRISQTLLCTLEPPGCYCYLVRLHSCSHSLRCKLIDWQITDDIQNKISDPKTFCSWNQKPFRSIMIVREVERRDLYSYTEEILES